MQHLKFFLFFVFLLCISSVTAYDLKENYMVDDDTQGAIYNTAWWGQTFNTSVGYDIKIVGVKVFRVGAPDLISISIYPTNLSGEPNCTDAPLVTGTFNGTLVTDSSPGEWANATFDTAYTLVAGTKYAIVMNLTGDVSNYIDWRLDGSSAAYTGGQKASSSDGGAEWSLDSGDDMMFATYNDAAASDTCTYTSSNWEINGSDSCNITTSYNLGGNDITITGPGTIVINSTVINATRIDIIGATVNVKGGRLGTGE